MKSFAFAFAFALMTMTLACAPLQQKTTPKREEQKRNHDSMGSFISEWQLRANEELRLPLPESYRYDFYVDWGDGTEIAHVDAHDDPDATHVYQQTGKYTVRISGLLEAWSFWRLPQSSDNLLRVVDLGAVGWKSFFGAFSICRNLSLVRGGDVADVVNMSSMFDGSQAVKVVGDDWDTGNVEDMSYMFAGARVANPQVQSWDTRSVKDMSYMFANTYEANPDVSAWNTSNVEDMGGMFFYADKAQPDTSAWNTVSVKNMANMFMHAKLANPDTSCWHTTAVENMSNMFNSAPAAQPDVSCWDVRNVKSMDYMFRQTGAMKLEVSDWDLHSIGSMIGMFAEAGMPADTYSVLLQRLAETSVQADVRLDAGDSKYHHRASAARETLLANGWLINDAGVAGE
ncbi:MAG: BspA family leucine-rich repeat surface protein [Pseudomonadota bacterium]|nr:BspA family leucine-rich repeat surface protein [Pseudomonadota bacterium]